MTPCALASCRSQELHLRHESHAYLPELGKSEMEFIESKRPRLELLPDPLLRPSPLLAAGQPGGSEDLCKVRPGPPPGAPLKIGLAGEVGAEAGSLGGGRAGRGSRTRLSLSPCGDRFTPLYSSESGWDGGWPSSCGGRGSAVPTAQGGPGRKVSAGVRLH